MGVWPGEERKTQQGMFQKKKKRSSKICRQALYVQDISGVFERMRLHCLFTQLPSWEKTCKQLVLHSEIYFSQKSTSLTERWTCHSTQSFVFLLESYISHKHVCALALLTYTPTSSIWSSTPSQFGLAEWMNCALCFVTAHQCSKNLLLFLKLVISCLEKKFGNSKQKTWDYQKTLCCCPRKPHLLPYGCSWKEAYHMASSVVWLLPKKSASFALFKHFRRKCSLSKI